MKIKRAKNLSEQKQDDLQNLHTSPKIKQLDMYLCIHICKTYIRIHIYLYYTYIYAYIFSLFPYIYMYMYIYIYKNI